MELTGFRLEIKRDVWTIPAIIAFRSLSGLGLKESKAVIDWVCESRHNWEDSRLFFFNIPTHVLCPYKSLQTHRIGTDSILMIRSSDEFAGAAVPPHFLPDNCIQSLEEQVEALKARIEELNNDVQSEREERLKDLRVLRTVVIEAEEIPDYIREIAENTIGAFERRHCAVLPMLRTVRYSFGY